jgi:hypothetical protein
MTGQEGNTELCHFVMLMNKPEEFSNIWSRGSIDCIRSVELLLDVGLRPLTVFACRPQVCTGSVRALKSSSKYRNLAFVIVIR